MRFDTHRVSAYLVEALQAARPALEVIDHGGDIIHVRASTGDQFALYFIESPITVYEIRGILEANTAAGVYSLFILWGELFMPVDGSQFRPDNHDWMTALLAVHQDKIYAFDPYASGDYIFPVYFERLSGRAERAIRYGQAFDAARLHPQLVETHAAGIAGRWRMASFENQRGAPLHCYPDLAGYYARLGLNPRLPLTREAVKRAYRRRARQLHPDVNAAHDATEQMQMLNHAYQHLLELTDDAR